MRVCLVPQKYPPDVGGVASASHRYARGLVEAGHEVIVVGLDSQVPPGSSESGVTDGVSWLRVGTQRRIDDTLTDWFEQIVARHRSEPFDLVVGRYVDHAAFVAVLAARFLGLPCVVSARGNDLDRGPFDPARLPQILWALTHADAVSAVSQELARKVVALVPSARVRVIHNGVDTALFSPGPRDAALAESLGLGSAATLAFFGEARLKKGLPVLLKAYALVSSQVRDVTLLLVGGVRKDDAALLEVFARQHPSARVVTVAHLPQAELPRYYRLATVVVQPSLRDGLPNALLEAMSSGRPVVASGVGGIPDVVRDGVDGVLVAPRDADTLASAILGVLADPAAASALGGRARARVVEAFSLARERAADLELLEELSRGR
jgi:glycosyltransferase involved in cell wall biosynthesis